jgi:hypothetical protein
MRLSEVINGVTFRESREQMGYKMRGRKAKDKSHIGY